MSAQYTPRSMAANRRPPLETIPTSLVGIQALAKRFRAAHDEITLDASLDKAAAQAGYSNWRHAQAMLAPLGSVPAPTDGVSASEPSASAP